LTALGFQKTSSAFKDRKLWNTGAVFKIIGYRYLIRYFLHRYRYRYRTGKCGTLRDRWSRSRIMLWLQIHLSEPATQLCYPSINQLKEKLPPVYQRVFLPFETWWQRL
jgi:hypothetical protein